MKHGGSPPQSISRRKFLHGAAFAAASVGRARQVQVFASAGVARRFPQFIAQIELDLNHIHKWNDSSGDTWDPFWADDDSLYSFNCDGRGFGNSPENLAFNKFEGSKFENLEGIQINAMDEYGPADQHGPDNATWKACGQECIDGIFYAFVSRNVYGNESHDALMRQTAFNASLIKSEDRGRNWRRCVADNYARPMWPGPSFGAPFFVHYGRNGGMNLGDRGSEYVYAASTNGFWNDGDFLILGRVRRRSLPQLDAGEWQYFKGGNGVTDSAWSFRIGDAQPALRLPLRCGQGPITHIPALDIYLLISWYNPRPLRKWFEPDEMKYDFYQAEHPWGPWRFVSSFSDQFLATGSHMYGPALCPRFQEYADGDVTAVLFTSGCQFEDVPAGIYKAWTIPVILHTRPLPPSRMVGWDDPAIVRTGDWTPDPESEVRAAGGITSSESNSAIELSFSGSGIECFARKAGGFGGVEIVIDGGNPAIVELGTRNFPALSRVSVFRRLNLPKRRHSLTVRNLGDGPVNIQCFSVYE